MRFVVTGASGFVGQAVVRRILAEGDEAVCYVRDAARARALEEAGATVREGSIGDPNAIAAAAKGAEVMIHAAAVPTHRASPKALAWVNVAGTENAVSAARHAGCARFVYVSCADVTLTNADRVSYNEDKDLMGLPLDAHARSKRLGEEIALLASTTSFEVTAIRPAWIWGPGDTTHLPRLVLEAKRHGGIRLAGAGDNLVATIYIDNLVDALLSAAEASKAAGRGYYVADNEFCDAKEYFEQLSRAVGIGAPRRGLLGFQVAYALARVRAELGGGGGEDALSPTDVVKRGRGTTFDITKACGDLDWEPRVSMADGMKALAEWVSAEGGPDAIAKLARPLATDADVEAQANAADDEG
jgi:nucleoside-diphosphate-sugar epimerase